MQDLLHRIQKNEKKLKSWAEKHKIEAYRLYDRDIPQYPVIIDRYKNFFLIYDKTDAVIDKDKNQVEKAKQALTEIFNPQENEIIVKKRMRQEGTQQYEKLDDQKQRFSVFETQAQFWINLYDYLDTGLFLDHRPLRQKVFKNNQGKRFLNLFCYTGSVSVFAALGGAKTTNVDMSKTYIQWSKDNFVLNNLKIENHQFIEENALEFLENESAKQGSDKTLYDTIYLDPPTFSNSKKMTNSFEVEKDQDFLITKTMSLLKQDGILFFSTNKRTFKLSEKILSSYQVKNTTESSIPIDFHDKKIHQLFEIKHIYKS